VAEKNNNLPDQKKVIDGMGRTIQMKKIGGWL
jgi:hypothetical protein